MKDLKTAAVFLLATLAAATAWAADDTVDKGVVTFAKNAGGYHYLIVKGAGKEEWLAVAPMQVKVGDAVEYTGGDVMTNFQSRAMAKTFDAIRFVTRIRVVGSREPKAAVTLAPTVGSPRSAMPSDATHRGTPSVSSGTVAVRAGDIDKPRGARTVGEVFADTMTLKDTKVTVRGKVAKFSMNILGKNWITIVDGTGKAPDDRLVAVTRDMAQVGTVVSVSGILKTGVSLGSGYQYKVLLDDVVVSR